MSMKPGVTVRPVALSTLPAVSRERSPTATMVSSRIPMSVRLPPRPVPSITVPPSILMSNIVRLPAWP